MKTLISLLLCLAVLRTEANSYGTLSGDVGALTGPTFASWGIESGDDLVGTWNYDASEAGMELSMISKTLLNLQTAEGITLWNGPFNPAVDAQEVPVSFWLWQWLDIQYGNGELTIHEGMDNSTLYGMLSFIPQVDAQVSAVLASVPDSGSTAGLLACALLAILAVHGSQLWPTRNSPATQPEAEARLR